MKIKLRILILALIISLPLALFSCAVKQEPSDASQSNITSGTTPRDIGASDASTTAVEYDPSTPIVQEDGVTYISNFTDRSFICNTVDELSSRADNIIEGICLESITVYQNEMMYTLSQVQVDKVIRGSLSIDSIIQIVEIGGRDTVGNYNKNTNRIKKSFEEEAPSFTDPTPLVVGMDGYFPMATGDEVLLFLGSSEGAFLKDYPEPQYDIIGSSDGKLFRNNQTSQYRRPSPANTDRVKSYTSTKERPVISVDADTFKPAAKTIM